jgi:hypothetical protein
MKYALLGEDHSSDEEKLERFTGEVGWSYLRPHYQSGVLFFVDPSLRLQHVGAAISADETDRVKSWMKSGDMVKIGSLHAAQWEGTETLFEALVVSPFVLCRPLG